MARKPTLSPSRLTTYLACPLKYRWTFVDPRGKWYIRAKSCYSFGLSIHKALEAFHQSGEQGVEARHAALAALDENWLEAGFSSADEMADAYGEGKAILERYSDEYQNVASSAQTLYIEKLIKKDMGEFMLVGRVDRVDEHEDGTLEVIDYKSGRQLVHPDDVRDDIAMGCYQLLLKELHPDRPITATIMALRSGTQASYAMSDEELAEFEFALKELGHKIMCHDYYELVPMQKGLCVGCDFIQLCRKHPEWGE